MEAPRKLEEENIKKFDFTKPELEYILANARFNDRQREVFDRLTDIHGRQKVIKIAMEMNLSDRTIQREIKAIKKKILKII